MRKYILLSFLLCLLAFDSYSQKSLRALKFINKSDLTKAFQQLEKGLVKQPGEPANFYVLAKLYSESEFREQFIDSAHYYVLKADTSFSLLSYKYKRKYARKGVDSLDIVKLHANIDSLAFFQSKRENTEKAYNHYLSHYGQSNYLEKAIGLRNDVAYEQALKRKTPAALSEFFRQYPEAPQAAEAREVFENLYYQQQVESNKATDFEAYIAERPNTLFAEKAVYKLLDIVSSAANIDLLASFIESYPTYKASLVAQDYYRILQKKEQEMNLLSHLEKGDKYFFNFLSSKLEDVVLENVVTDSCKWINRPIYLVELGRDELILNRQGDTLFLGLSTQINVLDQQWLEIKELGSYQKKLIHLSANDYLTTEANEFKVINDFFLAVKEMDGWDLKTFTGQSLLNAAVDSIWSENNLIFFKKANKFALAKEDDFKQSAFGQTKALAFLYSDYEFLEDSLLWLSSNDFETIVDGELQVKLPLQKAQIRQLKAYFLVKGDDVTACYNKSFDLLWSKAIDTYQAKGQKLAIKQAGKWAFQDWKLNTEPEFLYDSVRIFDSWLAYKVRDQREDLIFEGFNLFSLKPNSTFKLLYAFNLNQEARDQVKYVLITTEDKKQIILNKSGKLIWEGEASEIKVVSANELYVKGKNKQFIINSSGSKFDLKNVDAIGNYEGGALHILNDKKFGLYIISKDLMLQASSDTKMKVYQKDSIFTYEEKGLMGLLNEGGFLLAAKYTAIERVNDSVALVLLEGTWQLINLSRPEEVLDQFSFVKPFKLGQAKCFEMRKPTGFGILSENAEALIPPIYNSLELITLGKQNFWIAERNLQEIDYRVIVYYNQAGKVLFKQGFDEVSYLQNSCD